MLESLGMAGSPEETRLVSGGRTWYEPLVASPLGIQAPKGGISMQSYIS